MKTSQTDKICSASISYGTNCNSTLESKPSIRGTGNDLFTPSINFVNDNAEYCFEITASSANETVVLKGTLYVINTSIVTGKLTLKVNFVLQPCLYTAGNQFQPFLVVTMCVAFVPLMLSVLLIVCQHFICKKAGKKLNSENVVGTKIT